jgi:hypothetical protein
MNSPFQPGSLCHRLEIGIVEAAVREIANQVAYGDVSQLTSVFRLHYESHQIIRVAIQNVHQDLLAIFYEIGPIQFARSDGCNQAAKRTERFVVHHKDEDTLAGGGVAGGWG